MKFLIELNEYLKDNPDRLTETDKKGRINFVSFQYKHRNIGFSVYPPRIGLGGFDHYSLSFFWQVNNIVVPDLEYSDRSANELLWKTFYKEYEDSIKSFIKKYSIGQTILDDHKILGNTNHIIFYENTIG